MEKFAITRLVTDSKSINVLRRIAALYCEIWREPPWDENFWTIPGVIADIQKEMSLPNAEGFVAQSVQGEVVGFTWGYRVTKDDLRVIADTHKLDYLFDCHRSIFYIDELGVASSFRGLKIGKKLTEKLLAIARDVHEMAAVVLRTDTQADRARALYQRMGFEELPISDARYSNRTYWLYVFRE